MNTTAAQQTRSRSARPTLPIQLFAAWLLPVGICLLQLYFWEKIGPYPWFLFGVSVVLAPLIGGLWGGVGATLVAVPLVWYFFLPPRFSFGWENPGQLGIAAVFTTIGCGLSYLLQRLRNSEQRFRTITDNSPSAIIIWDEQGMARHISPTIERLAGRRPTEILHYHTLIAASPRLTLDLPSAQPSDPASAAAATKEAFTSAVDYCIGHPDEKVMFTSKVYTPSGEERVLETIFQAIMHTGARCEVVSITTDITAHEQLAQVLLQAKETLEQQLNERTAALQVSVAELQRANAGKDAFLAAVSHELRTPLSPILALSDLLQDGSAGSLNERQQQYAHMIHQSADRLLATINSILRYTNLVTGELILERQPCRPVDLCAGALAAIAPEARRKQVHLSSSVDSLDLQMESDPQSISQLLNVLLENAVKFTSPNGSVAVTVSAAGKDAVRMTVADTGIGIAADDLAELFQPFAQIDKTLARRYEGLGLGLAYARRLAELLGGSLAVESRPGAGSCFSVTLPRLLPSGTEGRGWEPSQ